MNLAFPALCILLLALPGVLFRKAFARAAISIGGRSTNRHVVNKYPVSIRPMTEEISISLVWTIILHVVWLNLLAFANWLIPCFKECNIIHWPPDYESIIRVLHGSSSLVSGSSGPNEYARALDYVAESRHHIIAYFLGLYAFSFVTGRISLELVRYFRLDHRFMMVRLEDQWFYFLRGEIFSFHEFRKFLPEGDKSPEICGTYISVVIPQSGKDYLYKGFLWDFHLDREGKLDRLVLHHAIRSEFAPEVGPESQKRKFASDQVRITDGHWNFQRVTSQLFTIRYADCKTLACTYFYIRQPKK